MDNNIKETYCSYEASKLLKARGFDVFCEATYSEYLKNTEYYKKGVKFEERGILHGRNSTHSGSEYYTITSAPTQALAMEWLRINHDIHLEVIWDVDKKLYWFVSITHIGDVEWDAIDMPRKKYYSPEEAVNAALVYILTNLIVEVSISETKKKSHGKRKS